MALSYVTLTGSLGAGAIGATAIFTPSNWLTDAADAQLLPPEPVAVRLSATGTFTTSLLATDNAAPLPAGWTWTAVFAGISGVAPNTFSFRLPFANGSVQDISAVVTVTPASPVASYLPTTGGTMTGPLTLTGADLAATPVALTDATTISVNAAAGNNFRVTLGGSRVMGNPASPSDGQRITFEVIQDATGSRTLSWGSAYGFSAAIPQPVLSTTPGDHDFIAFTYSAATALWYCVGAVLAQYSPGSFPNPMNTAGDMITGGASGVAQRLGIGSSGQVLQVVSGAPAWSPAVGFTNPMTTLGDLISGGASGAAARLAGNTTATKEFLTSTGSGGVATAPAWATIAAADLPAATTSVQGAVILDGTASDITALGTQAAGATGKGADAGHAHPAANITPPDHGLLVWSSELDSCNATAALTAGNLYLIKLIIRSPLTISSLWISTTVAASGASSGTFCGLYSSAGSLLTGSADVGASLTSTGNKQLAVTTPQPLSAGTFVWAALLVNFATTQPTVRCATTSGASIINLNLTAATFRAAVNGTLLTSLPPNITPSSNGQSGSIAIFVGAN